MTGNIVSMTGEELEQAAEEAKRLMEESSGQMALDMTLASDRDMKENLETIIEFRLQTLLGADSPPSDGPLDVHFVKSRHEAYGIAAENFCQVEASIKKIRGDMTKLLSTLGDVNLPALEAVGALLNSTTLAAMDVITMAAEMKKAMTDLYAAEQSEPTPLEELSEDNGFEEAEDLEDMDTDNDFDEEDE